MARKAHEKRDYEKRDYEKRDYIEWEAEKDAPQNRADGRWRVENIFDREVRRRVGELIARAREDAEKSKK